MNSIQKPGYNLLSIEEPQPQYTSIDVAKIVIDKPFMCKALSHTDAKYTKA